MDYGFENISSGRGVLIEAHLADLHFGAFSPSTQFGILKEQVLDKLWQLPKLDIISIDGDTFDHKVMSNSETAMYACSFIGRLVDLARAKNATLVLLHGTSSHDYDQLKLFYSYMEDNTVDVRVVTSIKFEEIKGARILMIPELYGVDESVYQHYFFESGWYDEAFVHGTFEGAVYGNNVGNGRLLTPRDFVYCKGVAISGHVHKSGCFSGFFYYCGCPYRWQFGEEEEKGFLILMHDLDTQIHYVDFEPICSFKYNTIYLDQLVSEDPKLIIDYINKLKQEQSIDFIKVRFRVPIPGYNRTIINNYYRNNRNTFVEFMNIDEIQQSKVEQEVEDSIEKYKYFYDINMTPYDKFVKLVNDSEGYEFITVKELTNLLSENI